MSNILGPYDPTQEAHINKQFRERLGKSKALINDAVQMFELVNQQRAEAHEQLDAKSKEVEELRAQLKQSKAEVRDGIWTKYSDLSVENVGEPPESQAEAYILSYVRTEDSSDGSLDPPEVDEIVANGPSASGLKGPYGYSSLRLTEADLRLALSGVTLSPRVLFVLLRFWAMEGKHPARIFYPCASSHRTRESELDSFEPDAFDPEQSTFILLPTLDVESNQWWLATIIWPGLTATTENVVVMSFDSANEDREQESRQMYAWFLREYIPESYATSPNSVTFLNVKGPRRHNEYQSGDSLVKTVQRVWKRPENIKIIQIFYGKMPPAIFAGDLYPDLRIDIFHTLKRRMDIREKIDALLRDGQV